MPEYTIVIKGKDNKTKKSKVFCSCIRDAEDDAKSSLEKGEVLVSVTNHTFPMGHIKAVNR